LCVAGFIALGCIILIVWVVFISEDNRKALAINTLYEDNLESIRSNFAVNPVFTGALNGKFPAGTKSQLLVDYVSKNKGHCSSPYLSNNQIELRCAVVLSSTFCAASKLEIKAVLEVSSIKSIQATNFYDGC
jgi:hypothetical protein